MIPRPEMARCGSCGSTFPVHFFHTCPVRDPVGCLFCAPRAHALNKLVELERLMGSWARCHDLVLAKAARKVLRQLATVGREGER